MRCFGVAEVEVDGLPVSMHSRRSMALLAFVVMNGGRHARSSLAATFWEDARTARARANLRSVLSMLQSSAPGLLEVSRESVGAAADIDLDVRRFLSWVATAEDPTVPIADRIAACRAALDLHRGELLEGFEHLGITGFVNWLESERATLARRGVDAAQLLVELLVADDQPGRAADEASRLIALDRYREASYLISIRALISAGEPHRAIQELARCRAAIVDDLGLPLGAEILALERRIREEHPEAGSARPVVSRLGGLPMPRVLFGRDELIDRIVAVERTPTGGLVTLWGPAGVGKTSLAIAAAHRWREHGRDVVFVDATTATDAPQLSEILANQVGGSSIVDGPAGLLAGVANVLADRAETIIVDNIEQVDGAEDVLRELLERCPGLLLLATSRRPMRIAAESLWIVPPLDPPTEAQLAPSVPGDISALGAVKRLASVQLFQHRCVTGGAQPATSPEELRAVGRICRLVDGLPLAIELIASRRRIMGLAEIEESLRRGLAAGDLSMVDGGSREVPERHRGLGVALSSTLPLLEPRARRLFAELSVFEGPFSFDAIAAVCPVDGRDRGSLMRCVESLVDVHLLIRQESRGRVWFRMLSSVRALAASLLVELGQSGAVLERRLAYDCELVERSAEEYVTPANTEWFWFLDEYLPTLRGTLDELHARRDPRELSVVTSLAPYWFDRGRVAEAHRRLAAARMSGAHRGASWLEPLRRLWSAGMRAEALGYGTAAGTLTEVGEALTELRAASPPPAVELRALRLAVHVHVIDPAAPLEATAALAEAGIALAESAAHPWFRVEFVFTRGIVQHLGGDDHGAAMHFRIAIAEAEQHGNRRVSLYARMMLDIVGGTGQPGGTIEHLSELLDLSIELGDHRQTSWLTMSIGTLFVLGGDLHNGSAHFLDALTLSRDADYFIGIGCCLMGGAAIAVLREENADAIRFHASVEPDLIALGRSMPQSYLEVYGQITGHLQQLVDADPELAAAWTSGAIGPRGVILTRLASYLAAVRDRTAADAAA